MKKNIFNTIVPSSFNDYRIDKFLHSEITELSRTRLQTLIHDGHVKLNNIIINDPAKKIKSKNEIKINYYILLFYQLLFYNDYLIHNIFL